MTLELLLRALVGGVIVPAFALIADVVKPKRFAGLFGAAPSVALASLGLAIGKNGHSYAALEARSMMAGAIAFFIYAYCVCVVMMKYKPAAWVPTLSLTIVWAAAACVIWWVWLR